MVEKRGGDLKRETSGPLAAPILAAKGSAGFVTADMAGGVQKIKHARDNCGGSDTKQSAGSAGREEIVMRFFLAIIITTFFIGRAEAAYIPDVPACRALLTYQAVEQCFSALNKGITPDTTSCGVIDINSIMASTNGLRSEIIGDTWRNIGSLILHHCSYTQGTKAIFLSMEKDIFGGPTQRENAERAWKRCIAYRLSNQCQIRLVSSILSVLRERKISVEA